MEEGAGLCREIEEYSNLNINTGRDAGQWIREGRAAGAKACGLELRTE